MSRRSSTCLRILSVSILSYLTQDVNILRTIVDKILKIQESVKVVVMSKNTLVWSLYLILSSRPRSNLRSPMCPSRLPCLHGGGALAVIINSNYNYITHKRMKEKQHQKVCTIKILVVLKLVRCACMAVYLSGGVRDLRRYRSLLRDLSRVMNKYFFKSIKYF